MFAVINDKNLKHFKNEMIHIFFVFYKYILYLTYIIILYNEKHMPYNETQLIIVQPKKKKDSLNSQAIVLLLDFNGLTSEYPD